MDYDPLGLSSGKGFFTQLPSRSVLRFHGYKNIQRIQEQMKLLVNIQQGCFKVPEVPAERPKKRKLILDGLGSQKRCQVDNQSYANTAASAQAINFQSQLSKVDNEFNQIEKSIQESNDSTDSKGFLDWKSNPQDFANIRAHSESAIVDCGNEKIKVPPSFHIFSCFVFAQKLICMFISRSRDYRKPVQCYSHVQRSLNCKTLTPNSLLG